MKPGKQRKLIRVFHLIAAGLTGFYVYAPINGTDRLMGKVIVFPALVVTGSWMWQQARVRRLLSRDRTGPRQAATV